MLHSSVCLLLEVFPKTKPLVQYHRKSFDCSAFLTFFPAEKISSWCSQSISLNLRNWRLFVLEKDGFLILLWSQVVSLLISCCSPRRVSECVSVKSSRSLMSSGLNKLSSHCSKTCPLLESWYTALEKWVILGANEALLAFQKRLNRLSAFDYINFRPFSKRILSSFDRVTRRKVQLFTHCRKLFPCPTWEALLLFPLSDHLV